MSHLYIVPDGSKDLSKSAHQKILKEEQTIFDHVVDVMSKRCRIVEIGHASIDNRLFSDGSANGRYKCHDGGGTRDIAVQ